MKKNIYNTCKGKGVFLVIICIIFLSGCRKMDFFEEGKLVTQTIQQKKIDAEFVDLIAGTKELYDNALEKNQLNSLKFQKQLIDYLGNKGNVAVDINNQIDMVHAEQVEKFCEKAKQRKKANVIIYSVVEGGTVVRYELNTDGKGMDAIVSTVHWINSNPCMDYYHEFKVHSWNYTEKGYFFIEEYKPPGFDGAPGQTGFRVKPLDQKLRELNQRYVLPIGYKLNNMLITEWNEQDYSNLNFYDLYELMYPLLYGKDVPYVAEAGVEYQIPKDEFENVFHTYFQIKSEQIQENANYNLSTQSYQYRPRGIHDCELPYEPYPEVISYEELGNGKLKLVIEAVWEKEKSDHAIKSELVVQPLKNGKIHYLSNKVLSSKEDEARWYRPRLTDEEWTKFYADTGE